MENIVALITVDGNEPMSTFKDSVGSLPTDIPVVVVGEESALKQISELSSLVGGDDFFQRILPDGRQFAALAVPDGSHVLAAAAILPANFLLVLASGWKATNGSVGHLLKAAESGASLITFDVDVLGVRAFLPPFNSRIKEVPPVFLIASRTLPEFAESPEETLTKAAVAGSRHIPEVFACLA